MGPSLNPGQLGGRAVRVLVGHDHRETPDVLWFEGTAEMRFVSSAIGAPTDELDRSADAWWAVTRKEGLAPLGADRTVTGSPYNEYHVWPTAAAGGWTVLSGASDGASWAETLEK